MGEPTDADYEALFPADCHIKVIAVDIDGVHKNLNLALVELGISDRSFQPGNKSAKGKYISYEIRLYIETRARMQEIDRALKAVGGVKMIL